MNSMDRMVFVQGDDGGVVIKGDGLMTFSGFGSVVLGVLLLDFLIEFLV